MNTIFSKSRIQKPPRFLRPILLAIALAFSPLSHAGAPANEPARPWYQRALVGMEVGPTGAQFGDSDPQDSRYCKRFNGGEIVQHCVSAHSEYLVIWARDGDYAYYNSKLLPKAPGLGERDPLRETLDAARPHHLPIIAYCVAQQGGHFLKAHPEFEMRDAQGNRIGRFCYNSGYLEVMKQILAEQLDYGIDGFHIDMLDQGFGPPYGCWCETCQTQFMDTYGAAMPQGITWDENWDRMLAWRYRASEKFMKALYAHVKSLNARATVDFNYHGNPPFSFEVGQRPVQHAGHGDFVTGETGVWGFSALGVGLNAEFYRASMPGKPFQIAMQRGVRMYHDQTTRPLNDLRWELLNLLTHGAFVTVVDKTAFDGSLDPVACERVGSAFDEVQMKRSHFGHAPIQEVGIYFSSRTRDWVGREDPGTWFRSFQGAHKALVYEHLTWGVVLDENATLETLRRHAVLLLPNAGILKPEEVDRFRQYVESGGHLIVTGQSGAFDRRGQPQASSALEKLIGAKLVEPLRSLDNWVRYGSQAAEDNPSPEASLQRSLQSALFAGIRSNWPFLVKGPALIYQPTTAIAVGELLKPHRTTRQTEGKEGTEWPMSADQPVGPAALVHRVGSGIVLTFAGSPDYATASEHSIVEARKLLRNAVRALHPTPLVRIDAPAHVEAVLTGDPANRVLRVHLLAYLSPPATTPAKNRPYVLPSLIEDLPLFRANLRLLRPWKEVTFTNPSTLSHQQDNEIEVTVNDVHEVISFHY